MRRGLYFGEAFRRVLLTHPNAHRRLTQRLVREDPWLSSCKGHLQQLRIPVHFSASPAAERTDLPPQSIVVVDEDGHVVDSHPIRDFTDRFAFLESLPAKHHFDSLPKSISSAAPLPLLSRDPCPILVAHHESNDVWFDEANEVLFTVDRASLNLGTCVPHITGVTSVVKEANVKETLLVTAPNFRVFDGSLRELQLGPRLSPSWKTRFLQWLRPDSSLNRAASSVSADSAVTVLPHFVQVDNHTVSCLSVDGSKNISLNTETGEFSVTAASEDDFSRISGLRVEPPEPAQSVQTPIMVEGSVLPLVVAGALHNIPPFVISLPLQIVTFGKVALDLVFPACPQWLEAPLQVVAVSMRGSVFALKDGHVHKKGAEVQWEEEFSSTFSKDDAHYEVQHPAINEAQRNSTVRVEMNATSGTAVVSVHVRLISYEGGNIKNDEHMDLHKVHVQNVQLDVPLRIVRDRSYPMHLVMDATDAIARSQSSAN